jgi:hypothetical protein
MSAFRIQQSVKTRAILPGKNKIRLLSLGIVIGILMAACRFGSPSADPSANLPAANSGANSGANGSTGSGNNSTPGLDQGNPKGQAPLPGTEEFGLTKEELVTSIEAVESLISGCMREAGFDYIAADYATVRRGMVSDKSLPGLSEREYFVRHGYGISTLYTGLPPQLADEFTPAKIGLGDQNVRILTACRPQIRSRITTRSSASTLDATFAVSIEQENFSRTGAVPAKPSNRYSARSS